MGGFTATKDLLTLSFSHEAIDTDIIITRRHDALRYVKSIPALHACMPQRVAIRAGVDPGKFLT